jgi:hypothetical protein
MTGALAPGLGLGVSGWSERFCPHCARPLPTSLLEVAIFLCGDPELRGDRLAFVCNIRKLLLLGLNLGPAHHARLLDLYINRHKVFADHYRDRRARIVEAADV